jgi:SAM-dependent methyltransferase
VKAFDISPNCVRIAKRLARKNDVESFIEVSEGVIENLMYPDETFDIVVGTRILHHVEIEPATQELVRVLKPGAFAIFWEPTYKNPFFRAMRKIYRALSMPKHGTTFEHPLSRQEITILQDAFEGRLRMHAAPFVFFSHLALVSGLTKWKLIEKIVNVVDYVIDRALPFLRKWSYHQILVLEKEMKDSETSFST